MIRIRGLGFPVLLGQHFCRGLGLVARGLKGRCGLQHIIVSSIQAAGLRGVVFFLQFIAVRQSRCMGFLPMSPLQGPGRMASPRLVLGVELNPYSAPVLFPCSGMLRPLLE